MQAGLSNASNLNTGPCSLILSLVRLLALGVKVTFAIKSNILEPYPFAWRTIAAQRATLM